MTPPTVNGAVSRGGRATVDFGSVCPSHKLSRKNPQQPDIGRVLSLPKFKPASSLRVR
jgi:hypothetical protein